jgi:hypothetical protein
MYEEDSQPSYERRSRTRNSDTGIKSPSFGWTNTLPKLSYPCGHVHTSIEHEICEMFQNPLYYCKIHVDTKACRYYCRRLNLEPTKTPL